MSCILVVFVFLFYVLSCNQQIISITSLKEAQAVLDEIDTDTVIFFDIDETLTISENKSLWRKNILLHEDFFHKLNLKILYGTDYPKQDQCVLELQSAHIIRSLYGLSGVTVASTGKPAAYYRSIWKNSENLVLIEQDSAQVIRSLQNRGVVVLACTAIPARGDHVISYYPELRFKKLKRVDIDFTKSNIPDTELKSLKDGDGDYTYHPVLYQGILCTGKLSKGIVIGELFDTVSLMPKKVIFFDDVLQNVEDVRKEMNNRDITFIGYHYGGAESLVREFDEQVVEFQMQYLIEHEAWLNESEAKAKMDNTSREKQQEATVY